MTSQTIPRHLADRLRAVARHYPVVLLTGARQTGKTTLLREVFPDAPFFTLDLPSVAYEAEHGGMAFLDSLNTHPAVVFDEVQYAPALFRHLKVAVDADRHRMGRFLMTGSQKFALMQSVSESLAGRCVILEMDTLSAAEMRDANPFKMPALEDFLWRGGYPELWRAPEMLARDFYASYLATYLERDVRQLVNVASLRDFERFIRVCATRSGSLVNLASLAVDVGVAGTTAKQWLSVLEASNIIHLLPPYFSNHGKRLIKTPKLYFKDTGLLCFLLGLASPEQMRVSPFIGAIWETFVLGQMQRAIQAGGSPAEIYFWRDAHGLEVDFAVWLNGQLQLVEVKWAENGGDSRVLKPMAEIRRVLGKDASDRHLLVCRTPMDHWHPNDPSVRVVDGYRFRDWFHVPEPVSFTVREEPPMLPSPRKRMARKRAARRRE
jgi:uncharacterized protein